MASVHVPSRWEHALGLNADPSQDPPYPTGIQVVKGSHGPGVF